MTDNVLVIGNGEMGKKYQEILRRNDVSYIYVTSEIEFVKKLDECTSVIIASPFIFNEFYIRKTILSGKKVLVEKPAVCSMDSLLCLEQSISSQTELFSGHILRFFTCFNRVKEYIKINNLNIMDVQFERLTNKKRKKWWYDCENFLLWYEVLHSLDVLDYLFSLQEFTVTRRKLSYCEAFNTEVFIQGSINNIEIQISHDMNSNENMNRITITSETDQIHIINYSTIYVNGNLYYQSNFNDELDNALQEQTIGFIKETATVKAISFSRVREVLSTLAKIERPSKKK
ncbi:putative dehydrogenase [Bacillus mesophilus]|uniref:Gfo/Idh/MocA family oxidoreductase n=1 Tax=Bacillus mesophilus TaxID=1808955 RepID=A0A6M0Q9W1_9BACI|nr:hypothetical protein [Bacillus mesophilus]MBM7662283.1 putative dehydrogenase [Bacillus mesophilus]NEY73083.1 hypothetical protein [Bacillus mesophilus]